MSMLDLDLQVCHSLYSTANALIRAYRPHLEPFGLTYPQYIVMLSLWQHDGVSVKALSQHTRLDSGTLTPILKRMENQGLLSREHSSVDERQKSIVLTKAGKKLRNSAANIPEKIACSIPHDIEKSIQLKQLCESLYDAIERRDETLERIKN